MTIQAIEVGGKKIGPGAPCFLIAEIGINHNGDVELAKKLINLAADSGCDAVKFQKRTVDVVYTAEELAKPRPTPFGETNGDLKRGLEFGEAEYRQIDAYCRQKGILWFASPWDVASVDFLEKFNPPCHKIASACLTDKELLHRIRQTGRPVLLSTGMSSMEEVEKAVKLLEGSPLVLMHTTSTYPSADNELNLAVIETLRNHFNLPVGYSGHEVSAMPSVMAVVGFDACCVERHITVDRAMWGSDQAASLEPNGITRLVRDIRLIETSMGNGEKTVAERELPIIARLRKKD